MMVFASRKTLYEVLKSIQRIMASSFERSTYMYMEAKAKRKKEILNSLSQSIQTPTHTSNSNSHIDKLSNSF